VIALSLLHSCGGSEVEKGHGCYGIKLVVRL